MQTSEKQKETLMEALGIDEQRGREIFKVVVQELPNHENISDMLKYLICSDYSTKEIIVMSYLVGVFNESPEDYFKAYVSIKAQELGESIKNRFK